MKHHTFYNPTNTDKTHFITIHRINRGKTIFLNVVLIYIVFVYTSNRFLIFTRFSRK